MPRVSCVLLALVSAIPLTAAAQEPTVTVPIGYGWAAPPPAVTAPSTAEVRFESDGDAPLAVYRHAGETWEPVCETPCARRFGLGRFQLAVAPRDEAPVGVRRRVAIERDVTLRLHYDDGGGDRALGVGLAIGGVVVLGGLGGGLTYLTYILANGAGGDAFFAIFSGLGALVGWIGGLALLVAGIAVAARGAHADADEAPAFTVAPMASTSAPLDYFFGRSTL